MPVSPSCRPTVRECCSTRTAHCRSPAPTDPSALPTLPEGAAGWLAAAERAQVPIRAFLARHAHAEDRATFVALARDLRRQDVAEDDLLVLAAAFVTMSGTHEGGLPPGAPATHKPFAVKHVHLFRFADDGRALEHWAVRDDLGLAMQAGLLPPG